MDKQGSCTRVQLYILHCAHHLIHNSLCLTYCPQALFHLVFNHNACTFRYTAKISLSGEKTKLSQDLLQREKELKTCQDQLMQYRKKYVSCVPHYNCVISRLIKVLTKEIKAYYTIHYTYDLNNKHPLWFSISVHMSYIYVF